MGKEDEVVWLPLDYLLEEVNKKIEKAESTGNTERFKKQLYKQKKDVQTLILAIDKYTGDYVKPVELDMYVYRFKLGFLRSLKAPYKFKCGVVVVLQNKKSGKVLQEDFVWVLKDRVEKAYRGLSNIDYTESDLTNRIRHIQMVLRALDKGILLQAIMRDDSEQNFNFDELDGLFVNEGKKNDTRVCRRK